MMKWEERSLTGKHTDPRLLLRRLSERPSFLKATEEDEESEETKKLLARTEQVLTHIVISDKTSWTWHPEEGDTFAVIYFNWMREKMIWLASRVGRRYELVGFGGTISEGDVLAWKAAPKKEKAMGRDFSGNDRLWFSQLLQVQGSWEKDRLSNTLVDERTRWQFHLEDKPRGSAAIAYYGPLLRLGLGEYNGRWFLYNGTNKSIVLDDRDVLAWKKVLK